MNQPTAILQMICPDRPGLVSSLSAWVYNNNGNILHSDHHIDLQTGIFLSRIEWTLEGFNLNRNEIKIETAILANQLEGTSTCHFSDVRPNVAILVSKQDHCALDLLLRVKIGELAMNVPLIISNHNDLQENFKHFDLQFHCIPTTNDKNIDETRILKLLKSHKIDLVILAKYMQILSRSFLSDFPKVINIHHSFLPAFKGAKPYHRAWERGVKLIGATAHYVTHDLDNGPIIDQQIEKVSHSDYIDDLIRLGRDTEKIALARAIRLHLNRRVLVYSGRTAVFT